MIPLLLRSIGASLGEPVAEDFDFLHRTPFADTGSLLDGGGSTSFWRPLAHQVYYASFGRLVLAHPALVAALHFALLALAGVLLYRCFRPAPPGWATAFAATFPLIAESTRSLITWPSHLVDPGLILFSALALHEASRGRMASALASLLAALLCKETAVVTAVMLPLMPHPPATGARGRGRWSRRGGSRIWRCSATPGSRCPIISIRSPAGRRRWPRTCCGR